MNNFNLAFQKSKPLLKRNFLLTEGIVLLLIGISLPSYAADKKKNNPYIYSKKLTQAETCENAKKQVNSIQNSLFALKPNTRKRPKETYLDLLKQRDQIMGKKVMIEALLNIWDRYNSYLDANDKYNITPARVKKSLKGLTDLKALLTNSNPQSIQKYQLMSDVFKGISVDGIEGDDHHQNFKQLKERLEASCNKTENAHLMYCDIAKGQWEIFRPGLPSNGKAGSPQAMLQNFLDASSAAFGNETMGWFRNLSTMFVDNKSLKYDLVGNKNLSQNVSRVLDQAIKRCRRQLIDPSDKADCMKEDISKYTTSKYKAKQIKEYFGKRNISAQDIVDKYLKNSQNVAKAHEEAAGGLISKFTAIAQQHAIESESKNTAGIDMKKGVKQARDNFYKQSRQVDIAQLSKHLDMLQRNDDFYNQKQDNHDHKNTIVQKANEQLNAILKQKNKNSQNVNIFEADKKGGLSLNKTNFLTMLRNNKISKEELNDLLQGAPKNVNKQLAQIDEKLAILKKSTEFNLLEDLKKFSWKQLIKKCASSTDPEKKVTIINNANCAKTNTFSEVDKLIKFGKKYLTYQDNSADVHNLNTVGDNCEKLQKEQPKLYKSKHYSKLCHKVYDYIKTVAARQHYYSPDQVKARASVSTIWENGRKVSSYKKKSWAELMPGALKMSMPSFNLLGTTWVQTQGLKNQLFGVTTLMKNQYRYLQPLYYTDPATCQDGTLGCYYSSEQTAFFPRSGVSGAVGPINTGTNAFTTNSTFFNK